MPNPSRSEIIEKGQRLIDLMLVPDSQRHTTTYRHQVTEAIQAFRLLCDNPHTTEGI